MASLVVVVVVDVDFGLWVWWLMVVWVFGEWLIFFSKYSDGGCMGLLSWEEISGFGVFWVWCIMVVRVYGWSG